MEHNRQLKEMELEHHKKLRLLEVRQEVNKLVRAERRAVYLEMLRSIAVVWHFWADLRDFGFEDDYIERSRELQAHITRYAELLPQMQLSGTAKVRNLATELLKAFTACSEVLVSSAEKEVTEYTDDEEFEAQWQRALDSALQKYDENHIDREYRKLVNQIRDEMGSLSLEINGTGTP